jgi:hypothetical protein
MGNGVVFNNDMPMINGHWYNPATGDSFTAVDSFLEDNQFIVKTNDGRFIHYDQFQHYVQTEHLIPKGTPESKTRVDNTPKEVLDLIEGTDDNLGMLPDEMDLISRPLGNLNSNNIPRSMDMSTVETIATNTTIINKALSKRAMPEMNVDINWHDFPKQEMKMLMDLMDVELDEIIDWYVRSLDANHYLNCLRTIIADYIKKQFNEEPIVTEIQPEITPVPETPKKMGGPKATAARKAANKRHKNE